MLETTAGGVGDHAFPFQLIPAHKPEQMLENVRYAMTLGLPDVKQSAAHDEILSVAGGGPSLEDTWQELTGFVAAANGSLGYLIGKGVTPQMCGVCDPSEHMVDIVDAVPGVAYFVASSVHRGVFDKLIAAGCTVYLWHLHPIEGLDALLSEYYPDGWTQIPGGCTMGLRWITLGYHLGFRKFHLHGLDSSFREKSSHAYADHQDSKEWIYFNGYPTRVNFIGQVGDFIGLMDDGLGAHVEPFEIKMFGEGLLQSRYRKWQAQNPGEGFVWPEHDKMGQRYIRSEAKNIANFMDLVPFRNTVVQAGGNVGLYPAHLACWFNKVYTFEPDPVNYEHLIRNVGKDKKIICRNAALGASEGSVGTMSHEAGNVGAVHVVEGGPIPMVTIDSLDLTECDLIWLDIEGYEEQALLGAGQTIERFRPSIIVEDKHDRLAEVMKSLGYTRQAQFGNDVLYQC